jgi:hypothetical protein
MKRTLLLLGIVGCFLSGYAQTDFPAYPVPEKYRLKSGESLPVRLNNAELKYFPPILNQYGWSCNQSSSIGYVMTYEMNRLRDLDASLFENQYPALYVFNFLNQASAGNGVSYFDSWEIVKAGGNPTLVDYPHWSEVGIWMSGYEKYYHAMKNRIIENYSIHVGNPEGLLILKQFLIDHLDGQQYGGLANFQIASGNMQMRNTNHDSKDPGAPVLIGFGEVVGHALTVVGYDDEIGVDVNGDGFITNDRDINNDDTVDMRDWEMGSLILANTWGKGWGRDGFAYCQYRVLASEGHRGGIWNKSVHVVKPVKEMNPVLTMRVKMRHTSRNKFRILAGVSVNIDSQEPERVMGFPHFNYQGGDFPLVGENPADSTEFELGLDISSLVSDFEPGQELKFFLIIDEKDPASAGDGEIMEFSVINYTDGRDETISEQKNIPIKNNTTTTLSVLTNVDFNKVRIQDQVTGFVQAGELYTTQLEAEGGDPPYLWELVRDYREEHFEQPFPEVTGTVLSSKAERNQFSHVDLPFIFPYYGKEYESLIVDEDGALHLDTEYYDYPYSVDGSLVFKVRKSILPFGHQLEYVDDTDMVRFVSSPESVKIFWEAKVIYNDQQYQVQVGAYIYPDGRIEFHYGSCDNPAGDMYYWMSGISNGDGRSFKRATVSELGIIFKNYGVRFEPNEYPGEVSLTSEGFLSCRPDTEGEIWNVYVRVRDKNNQISTAAIPISTVNWEETKKLGTTFPNPFREVTNIKFLVPTQQRVVLRIYDTSGRAIKDIVNEDLEAGEYSYIWNGTDHNYHAMRPGLFFYRLEVGEEWETGKIVLLR